MRQSHVQRTRDGLEQQQAARDAAKANRRQAKDARGVERSQSLGDRQEKTTGSSSRLRTMRIPFGRSQRATALPGDSESSQGEGERQETRTGADAGRSLI